MSSYVFDLKDETLMSIESGILELESIKGSMVAMALGFGRIKMDRL
ncbi:MULTISPECIES: hypothetical protein [unclassified Oceanispirochaeta]|nr:MULTISPECIES: hypothetical protein [unclassified Oceanispirochaeta]MBF9018303.1 hypothetical protein [Oceanispirochaeta sp. M2]NPD74768.1 hypothetical protein [Oceanispirochaeta sp. M1]